MGQKAQTGYVPPEHLLIFVVIRKHIGSKNVCSYIIALIEDDRVIFQGLPLPACHRRTGRYIDNPLSADDPVISCVQHTLCLCLLSAHRAVGTKYNFFKARIPQAFRYPLMFKDIFNCYDHHGGILFGIAACRRKVPNGQAVIRVNFMRSLVYESGNTVSGVC